MLPISLRSDLNQIKLLDIYSVFASGRLTFLVFTKRSTVYFFDMSDTKKQLAEAKEELNKCRKALEDLAATLRALSSTNQKLVAENMRLNEQIRPSFSQQN